MEFTPSFMVWLEASSDGGDAWWPLGSSGRDFRGLLPLAAEHLAGRGVSPPVTERVLSTLARKRVASCDGMMLRLRRESMSFAEPSLADVREVLEAVDEPLATVQVNGAMDAVAQGLGCAGVTYGRTPSLLARLAASGVVVKGKLGDFREVFGVEPPSTGELLARFPEHGGKALRFAWWATAEAVERWRR